MEIKNAHDVSEQTNYRVSQNKVYTFLSVKFQQGIKKNKKVIKVQILNFHSSKLIYF